MAIRAKPKISSVPFVREFSFHESKESRVTLLPSKVEIEMARSERDKKMKMLPALQILQVQCVQSGRGCVFSMFIHSFCLKGLWSILWVSLS